MTIPTKQTWVVCEQSGRWAAALRLAMLRRPASRSAPRLYEVRGLAELSSFLNDRSSDLVLVEAGQANLAEVLDFFAEGGSKRSSRNVALLDESFDERVSPAGASRYEKWQVAFDALWEAGVTDVIESPRGVHRLLDLGERIAAAAAWTGRSVDSTSITEWAWSLLPWQAS